MSERSELWDINTELQNINWEFWLLLVILSLHLTILTFSFCHRIKKSWLQFFFLTSQSSDFLLWIFIFKYKHRNVKKDQDFLFFIHWQKWASIQRWQEELKIITLSTTQFWASLELYTLPDEPHACLKTSWQQLITLPNSYSWYVCLNMFVLYEEIKRYSLEAPVNSFIIINE